MKKIISILLTGVLLFAMTGCFAGESAYEIAVRNGFVGSETEWLASLKGADGKDGLNGIDGADGKDGIDGKDGVDGKDAPTDYAAAIERAYLSSVVIVSEFLRADTAASDATKTVTSSGSGVFYYLDKESGDAIIVTNFHVIHDRSSVTMDRLASKVSIFLAGDFYLQNPIEATIIGGSFANDVALLRISGSEILKNSGAMQVVMAEDPHVYPGQPILVVGNANSDGVSVTQGIVSVEEETIALVALDGLSTRNSRVIRIDAPANPGNSGGGIFNTNGEMISILQAKKAELNIEGMSYGIPMDAILGSIYNILKNCDETRRETLTTVMGVMMQVESCVAVYNSECGHVHLKETVVAQSVDEGRPAYGHVQPGDRFLTVEIPGVLSARDIIFMHDISDYMQYLSPGCSLVFTVEREGEVITITIPFDEDDFSK